VKTGRPTIENRNPGKVKIHSRHAYEVGSSHAYTYVI
jgi:hypothetical protein